jgi:glycosyltransferase involved in cell wall biosynthesis
MDDPAASVLIATRNRAEHISASLEGVLRSAAAAPFPAEVVIINNGSTDDTSNVLEEFRRQFPDMRIIDDPVPGKSGAINRGLQRTRGKAVVFTDDDVHVPESWVADMAGPILEGAADAVCGRVVLASHLARPWLTEEMRTAFAEVKDVSGGLPGMVGANMAASREAAIAIGFDEHLGPGARGFADDVLFNLRLKAAEYRLAGSAGPAVEHHFDADRLTYPAMRSLARRNGSSHAYLWHHWLRVDLPFLRLRWARCRVLLAWARWRRGPGKRELFTQAEYDQLFKLGFLLDLAQERHKPRIYGSR